MVNSTTISGNLSTDNSLFTIGKDALTNTKYFFGKVDEVRLFNIALTNAQFQKIVYESLLSQQ